MKNVSTMKLQRTMRTLLLAIACIAMPLSALAASVFENSWNATLDNAEGGSKTEDGQMIKTNDGCYLGVYTTGASDKQYEGRVVKFAADGKTLWEQAVQVERFTTAKKICEGNDGNIYVIGTTKVNDVTRAYIASLDQSGNLRGTKVFDASFSKCFIGDVKPYKDAVVAFYAGVTTINTQAYYSDVVDTDVSVVSEKERRISGTIVVTENIFVSGDWVLVTTQNDYTFFNLATGAIKNTVKGSFEGGCEYGGDFFLLQKGEESYTVHKFTVEDDEPATAWATEVDFTTSYYFNRLFADHDGNIYFFKKGPSFCDIAKLANDGSIEWKQSDLWLDSDVNDGFVYSLDVDSDQNMILAGHTDDFKVFTVKLDKQCNVLGCNKSVVFDDYKYAYTFEKQSSFVDGKLLVCGYVRPADLNAGYSQFFTLMNPFTENEVEWKTLFAAGPIPVIYPITGTFDKEGDSYVVVYSDNQPKLAKYDSDGKQQWISPIVYENATSCYAQSIVALANGNVVVAGYTCNDNDYSEYYKNIMACFDKDGNNVWTNHLSDKETYTYPNEVGLLLADDGDMIMVSSAFKAGDYTKGILIQKIDAAGNIVWNKTYISDKTFSASGAKLDQQGNIDVVGFAYGNDYVPHAYLEKFSQDGEIVFTAEHQSDENYRYIDSWTDKAGNTYTVGYTDQKGIYAVYDSKGTETVFNLSDDNGYWQSVAGNDKNAIIVGSFADANSGAYNGRIIALSTEKPDETAWTQKVANSEASSYACNVLAADDNVVVTGYVENSSSKQVAEYAIVLDADGNHQQTLTGDVIDNTSSNFASVGIYGDTDNFVTLSRFALDDYIYMGIVRKYTNTTSVDVETVKMYDGKPVKTVEYYDISGVRLNERPVAGFYIMRTVFTDGTTKVTKSAALKR